MSRTEDEVRNNNQTPDKTPFEALVEGFDDEGRGVARVAGKVVFIEGALPGERVVARYTRTRGRYDEARSVEILEPHPQRVQPLCPHHAVCGGCVVQHLEHPGQVGLKAERLFDNLTRIAKVEPEEILQPIVGEPWGYRKRARLAIKVSKKKRGGTSVGFRHRSNHTVADIRGCDVLDPRVGAHIGDIREAAQKFSPRAGIEQLEVSLGDVGGTLTAHHGGVLSDRDWATLLALGEQLKVGVNLRSTSSGAVAPVDDGSLGATSYSLPEFDLKLEFGAEDFTQVNFDVNRQMVRRVMELLRPAELGSVLDLFCGIGNLSLPVARLGTPVVGVEGSSSAVSRARDNVAVNGLTEARFEVGDLADAATCTKWLSQSYDGLLIDPPRAGAAAVIAALGGQLPDRIVYVSCAPATLARDADRLCNTLGYKLRATGIVDMFPHTNHVESLSLFER